MEKEMEMSGNEKVVAISRTIRAKRSPEEAKRELVERFGFSSNAGFTITLKNREIRLAEEFLRTIEKDPGNYPQFLEGFHIWIKARKQEIDRAKKN